MPPEPDGAPLLMLLNGAASVGDAAAPASGGNILVQLLVLLLLILLNAFFAASEIAIITLNDNKIKKMAEEGHKKAARILRLTKNSSSFLATIQVGVTLAGFLSSASASQSFASMLADALAFLPFSRGAVETIATVIITLILSYFSLVLGELVPKKIAMQRAEQLSFKVVGVLEVVSKIFKPFIWLLSKSTNGVTRVLGFDPNASEETVTEEEILMMVDAGEEKGVIEESAKDMIANIFDFDDTTVSEIMTHRTEVTALEDTSTVEDAIRIAMQEGYSRLPIFHEDLDSVLGVLYVKDLLKYVGKSGIEALRLTDIMRPAYFVPEGKKCSELFTEMTEKKLQLAIVCDEYGGTAGIISMEDLLEAIVGNIQDEYDNEEEEISQVGENAFTVEGSTALDEVSDWVGVDLPEGDYDTIAGLIVDRLGRIPKPGEHPKVEIEHISFTVQEVEDRRISKILVVINPVEPAEEEAESPPEKNEKSPREAKNARREEDV